MAKVHARIRLKMPWYFLPVVLAVRALIAAGVNIDADRVAEAIVRRAKVRIT